MEVKKIVEGMTAPQVAQVIDENFKEVEKIIEATDKNILIRKATSTFYGTIKMNFSSGKVNVKTERSVEGVPEMYIYHEEGYISFLTNIDEDFSFSNGKVFLIFDISLQKVILKTNEKEIPKDAILLEAFYSYGGSITRIIWTSPFIEKTGTFKYQDVNCSFSNPAKELNDELEINQLKNSVFGGEYSKLFEGVNQGSTISIDVVFSKGETVEISYTSQSISLCVIGLVYENGIRENNIITFYGASSSGITVLKENTRKILLYINSAPSLQNVTLKAKTNGVLGLSDSLLLSRRKATSTFYGTIEMNFSLYKIDVLVESSTTVNPTFLYHEGGYYSMGDKIEKSLTWSSDGLVIIYFDPQKMDIVLTTRMEDIPLSAILLEVFYSYGGNVTHIAWTSTFIIKNGFRTANTNCSFVNPSQIDSIERKLSQLEVGRIKPMSVKIFQRVGCIGDSYTAGYIYTSKGLINSSHKNAWPHYMESLTGNRFENWGSSGSTAKGWVLGAANLAKVKEEGNKCQAYIIGLMINDRTSADWNNFYTPVGVKTDIGTDADSYYAYYYKLVQEVVSVNPDAKIFCNTCPKWSDTDPYNAAVRDIVGYCKNLGQNVFLLDLAAPKYSQLYEDETFVKDYINGHYTSVGYEYMAECYVHIMSEVINENIAEFQDVAYIDFDEV